MRNTNQIAELDSLDFSILNYLQKDGRISYTIIAEELDISVGTVRSRVNKLLEDKILDIVGRVNKEKIGFKCYSQVGIYVRPASLKDQVASEIAKMKEVCFLVGTSGEYDLEADIICKDNEQLIDFVNKISKLEGIFQTKTTLYFDVYKTAEPDLTLIQD
jgi:Lrp/AsnC family transcriptional regulator for asnA, asnC and gidA